MSTSKSRPNTSATAKRGRKRRNNTVALDEEGSEKYRLWAMAVDRYFQGFPNKNEIFHKVSKEEEQKAARKYRRNRKMFENFLVTHNIFLAVNMASKYSNYYTDYDELISAAMDGLIEAAKRFDPKRGNKFSTCAVHWIFREIMKPFYGSTYNKHIKANTTVFLDSSEHDENRNSDSYIDRTFAETIDPVYRASCSDLRNPPDEIEYRQKHEKACKLLEQVTDSVNTSSLSVTDKKIFEQMFLEKKDSRDIRANLGITQGELIKSKNRIMTFVSDKFKDYNSAMNSI